MVKEKDGTRNTGWNRTDDTLYNKRRQKVKKKAAAKGAKLQLQRKTLLLNASRISDGGYYFSR